MVKRARVLEDVDADVPYAQTRLARRAPRARVRATAVMALFALGFLIEAAVTGQWLWAIPAAFAAGAALGLRAKRLGGAIAAGLLAVVAVLVPLALWGISDPSRADGIALAASAILGVAALPDVVTLLRDAELQHAYGLWARRDEAR